VSIRPNGFMSLVPGPRYVSGGEHVVLRDGAQVLIRQVRPADATLLADGFTRLSVHSRRMRFLTAKRYLSPADLRYLTNLDHHDHEAIGALSVTDRRGVGIARYIRDSHDRQAAELAVTVVDAWQGRGLGTQLVTRLTERARSAGIRRFTALLAVDNHAMLALLQTINGELEMVGHEFDIAEYQIALTAHALTPAT
jgi:RimJ/RimL family protein N-acetyltransferase